MNERIALSTVLTFPLLAEFQIMKLSFELFNGEAYKWYVRCDRPTAETLATYANVIPTVFDGQAGCACTPGDPRFNAIARQKMCTIADAWNSGSCDAVAFLDADLIITAEFLAAVAKQTDTVALTPNYHPEINASLEQFHGHFNSGFVLTRNRSFHTLWEEAFLSSAWELSDQVSLNTVAPTVSALSLAESANVGFWRSPGAWSFDFLNIPDNCEFLHVHLFQQLNSGRGWMEKQFALHCLKFLKRSQDSRHQRILKEVIARDESGWYAASLALSDEARIRKQIGVAGGGT